MARRFQSKIATEAERKPKRHQFFRSNSLTLITPNALARMSEVYAPTPVTRIIDAGFYATDRLMVIVTCVPVVSRVIKTYSN